MYLSDNCCSSISLFLSLPSYLPFLPFFFSPHFPFFILYSLFFSSGLIRSGAADWHCSSFIADCAARVLLSVLAPNLIWRVSPTPSSFYLIGRSSYYLANRINFNSYMTNIWVMKWNMFLEHFMPTTWLLYCFTTSLLSVCIHSTPLVPPSHQHYCTHYILLTVFYSLCFSQVGRVEATVRKVALAATFGLLKAGAVRIEVLAQTAPEMVSTVHICSNR